MNYLRGIRLKQLPPEKSYLRALPLVHYLASVDELRFEEPVCFLVGENGSGKSTLLEAIAVAMGYNAEGGSKDTVFSTMDSHSELHDCLTTIKGLQPQNGFFLRAESFYNTATYLEQSGSSFARYGGVSLHKRSHGEAFLALVSNYFGGRGLYLLDEPEAALSPQRLLTLLAEIDRLVKADSQFIIATHSPILMAYPRAEILQFGTDGLRRVAYKDTEHYQITKDFLEAPERMLKYLLAEDESVTK